MARNNGNINKARQQKKDEFYTLSPDIYNELKHYKDKFKGKSIYLPCDHPDRSNFYKVLKENMIEWGIERITCSCYPDGICESITQDFIPKRVKLKGDGDFNSDECKKIMSIHDVVITNPPFSLFREFVKVLDEVGVEFHIMGQQCAISYKIVYLMIRNNKMRVGHNFNKTLEFSVPDDYEAKRIDENGVKYCEVSGICWFTNLNLEDEVPPLNVTTEYNPEIHKNFINYDIINVRMVKEIPYNAPKPLGVPITFIKNYNPKQFRILSANDYRLNDKVPIKEHGLIKDKDGLIEGQEKPTFARIVIELLPEN